MLRRPAAAAWIGRPGGRSRRDRRVHRFNAAGPSGLVDRTAPGRQRRLDPEQQRELARCLENGPELAQDGVARWRRADLGALVERRFGVRYQERGMGKLARALGFSRISARPQHPKSGPEQQAEFKKTCRPDRRCRRRPSPRPTARALVPGREPDRPEGRADQAIGAPGQPAAAAQGPTPPGCLHLRRHVPGEREDRRARSSLSRHPGHEPAAGRDFGPGGRGRPCRGDPRPGWHGAKALRGPDNISLLPLPPDSPDLNPVENLWQFIKHNFRNARVFASYDAIVAACCDAWNRLCAIPGQIRSITTRDWAQAVNL